jgi:hypothetical protein
MEASTKSRKATAHTKTNINFPRRVERIDASGRVVDMVATLLEVS